MNCGCLDEADKALAQFNTRVVRAFSLDGRELAVIATERVRPIRGSSQAKVLFAAYCPICGKAYEKKKQRLTAELASARKGDRT